MNQELAQKDWELSQANEHVSTTATDERKKMLKLEKEVK